MFFGLDWDKLVLILIVAALLVGPERLPRYAETLARLTVRAREWLSGAKTRVKEELGDDFDDLNLPDHWNRRASDRLSDQSHEESQVGAQVMAPFPYPQLVRR